MKCIFLDIDGVVVLMQPGLFLPELMQNLKHIVDQTQAHIVLSSDWRRRDVGRKRVRDVLQLFGMDFLDCTRASVADGERPLEIADWIREKQVKCGPECIENFVAIDDRDLLSESGAEYIAGHFVKTRLNTGLTARAAQAAIEILVGTPVPNHLLECFGQSADANDLMALD